MPKGANLASGAVLLLALAGCGFWLASPTYRFVYSRAISLGTRAELILSSCV